MTKDDGQGVRAYTLIEVSFRHSRGSACSVHKNFITLQPAGQSKRRLWCCGTSYSFDVQTYEVYWRRTRL